MVHIPIWNPHCSQDPSLSRPVPKAKSRPVSVVPFPNSQSLRPAFQLDPLEDSHSWSGKSIKENKKGRKKERKQALDQKSDQGNKKVFRQKNINFTLTTENSFYHLSIRPNWIYLKNEAKYLILNSNLSFPLPSFFFLGRLVIVFSWILLSRSRSCFQALALKHKLPSSSS